MFVALALLATVLLDENSLAQGRRPFKPGERIETGGGMSVEILRCRGAGENEECEVQYYRADDLESTPRWENATLIRLAEQRVLDYKNRQTETPPENRKDEGVPANLPAENPREPVAEDKAADECEFGTPPGDASNTAKASAALFKRKIYDRYSVFANGTTTAPLRVGLTFLNFNLSKPFINIVRVDPGIGAHRLNDAAPVNALIYPVLSTHVVCEQYRDRILRKRVENKYACFKNRDGEWVCGADGIPKTTQLN